MAGVGSGEVVVGAGAGVAVSAGAGSSLPGTKSVGGFLTTGATGGVAGLTGAGAAAAVDTVSSGPPNLFSAERKRVIVPVGDCTAKEYVPGPVTSAPRSNATSGSFDFGDALATTSPRAGAVAEVSFFSVQKLVRPGSP